METTRILMKEIAKHFAGRPCYTTIYRWRTVGIKSASGGMVKLKTWRSGGRRYTTPEEIQRFNEAIEQ